jgi:hypothetical protein
VYKISSHGKLPVPNDKGYNLDPIIYDREFVGTCSLLQGDPTGGEVT